MKEILKKEAGHILLGSVILFIMGVLAAVPYYGHWFYITWQSIGFVVGFTLFFLLKKGMLKPLSVNAGIMLSFLFLLLPLLLSEDNIAEINLWQIAATLKVSVNVGLWAVALSIPYFAKQMANDKYTMVTMGGFAFINLLLLATSNFGYFFLFNAIIVITAIIVKANIPKKQLRLALAFLAIIVAVKFYKDYVIVLNAFENFLENFTIINSDGICFRSYRTAIDYFSIFGQGISQGVWFVDSEAFLYHPMLVTIVQFGAIGFIVVGSVIYFMVFLPALIHRDKRNTLEVMAILFIVIQVILGVLNGFDLLPIDFGLGIPFYSFSGLNLIPLFYVFGLIDFDLMLSLDKEMDSEESTENIEDEETEQSLFEVLMDTFGSYLFIAVLFTLIMLMIIGTTIIYNYNQNPFHPNRIAQANKDNQFLLYKDKITNDGIPAVSYHEIVYSGYTIAYKDSVCPIIADGTSNVFNDVLTKREFYIKNNTIKTSFTNYCSEDLSLFDLNSLFLFPNGDLGLLSLYNHTPNSGGTFGGACDYEISVYSYNKKEGVNLETRIEFDSCMGELIIDDIRANEDNQFVIAVDWIKNQLKFFTEDDSSFCFDITTRKWYFEQEE